MKTYRLIKTYPGSPKLGTILTHEELQYCNWNEYYQEVVEKDYEILSLIEGKVIYPCDKYSKDFINQLFNTLGINIHSVKRNDGEIFTIGDKVIGYNNSITKIKTIDLVGEVSLNIGTDKHEGFSLNSLKKAKQPLFTTEDGVDIFEGDKYYPVNKTYWIVNEPENTCKINYETYHKNTNNFSTKEKAEEYILMNKPVLSLKEIKETTTIKGLSLKKLEKLVQQKLKS